MGIVGGRNIIEAKGVGRGHYGNRGKEDASGGDMMEVGVITAIREGCRVNTGEDGVVG